jgi:PAS domain S-box-containing protein
MVRQDRQDRPPELFWAAFKQSRNPMVLLDHPRRIVEANGAFLNLVGYARDDLVGKPGYGFVVGGPTLSPREWAEKLAVGHFTGETELICADGSTIAVQWGVDEGVVTGHHLILLVALTTSRWGRHFRRPTISESEPGRLSERERDVVALVARGYSGPEIAGELHIAHDTVRRHVHNAMTKTGARSRAHLVAKALGDGQVLDRHAHVSRN